MKPKPNILLVMVDDMGYSDLGCFGGSIRTPNIDALGTGGIRFTQFYNTARCCPARASLLTGLYPHQSGMGWMTAADLGRKGYRGDLNDDCATVAEVLRPAGYSTYMSGKWHVSLDKHIAPDGPRNSWPCQRGFDRHFGTLEGCSNYFRPNMLLSDNTVIHPPDDFYYTDAISDHACGFVQEHCEQKSSSPFFMYVAYTAPHWPLHARPEDIVSYRGSFSRGWDTLRGEKHDRMRNAGAIAPSCGLSDRDGLVHAWDKLSGEEKNVFDLKMSIYAAQITSMDRGVGRIIDTLRRKEILDDTLILFLSDNGGCHEELDSQGLSPSLYGTADSFVSYGRPWANLSNAPFREFKSWVHEGGIATPLIAHWPNGSSRSNEWDGQLGHITDIMPTCLDVAGALYPPPGVDRDLPALVGKSLLPCFEGKPSGRDLVFLEHEANRALRREQWKIVAKGIEGAWELYDMHTDRSELTDLADDNKGLVREMADQWMDIADRSNVLPLDGRGWHERIADPSWSPS